MAKKSLDTKILVDKIEKLTKERLTQESVVSLEEFRKLRTNKESKCLLIIEDDETMRAAMKRIFEGEGFKVKTAADGTQLASVLDDSPIDLIILDIGLPWINGYELAKLLKEHEDLKNIPLIFVSGKTSDLDVKKGMNLGADEYIKKPFDVDYIKAVVSKLLKIKQS
ncbi:MAG: response regulator [Bdellovibrionaceae bacterium]|nr:response regulator [Pseudobdellovibrionaceae bacterium]